MRDKKDIKSGERRIVSKGGRSMFGKIRILNCMWFMIK